VYWFLITISVQEKEEEHRQVPEDRGRRVWLECYGHG